MRLIDADALKVDYLVPSSMSSTPNFYYVSKASIDKAPTIDAVPVVRCKDCFIQSGCQFAQYQGNGGYCSLGERRES